VYIHRILTSNLSNKPAPLIIACDTNDPNAKAPPPPNVVHMGSEFIGTGDDINNKPQ
jgi:hypothetical protein